MTPEIITGSIPSTICQQRLPRILGLEDWRMAGGRPSFLLHRMAFPSLLRFRRTVPAQEAAPTLPTSTGRIGLRVVILTTPRTVEARAARWDRVPQRRS